MGSLIQGKEMSASFDYDDYQDDGYDDEDSECSYCGGQGWGIEGDDWDCNDPLWIAPGTVRTCPNCHGSGAAEDMTFW